MNGTAGVVSVVGLLGLWGSTYLHASAFQKGAESLAAAILAIGVLQVLSEAYLNRRLSDEVFSELEEFESRFGGTLGGVEAKLEGAIQQRADDIERSIALDRRLRPSGVESVERAATDWASFFAHASSIDVVPPDLTGWLADQWPPLLEAARHRAVVVKIHLVNVSGSAAADEMAFRTGKDVSTLTEEFARAVQTLKDAWRSEHHDGARLIIHTCDRVPGFGVVFTDDRWATVLPGANGPALGTSPLVTRFAGGSDPGFLDWAKRQPTLLSSEFFDEVVS